MVTPGSAKANGREPKSGLGHVFNFKLDRFAMRAIAWRILSRPSLLLKLSPGFILLVKFGHGYTLNLASQFPSRASVVKLFTTVIYKFTRALPGTLSSLV